MKLELNIFNKSELIRACQLIGYKNTNNKLEEYTEDQLTSMIKEKCNPKEEEVRELYYKTLDMFKVEYSREDSDEELRTKLYKFNCRKINEAFNKMSKRKKNKLSKKIEDSLDEAKIDELRKIGRKGAAMGGGVLLLQGGAIAVTGSNLGICMLLTTGLSGLSGLVGITFPFAAYTGAAILGGKILAIANFLANPAVAAILISIGVYSIYKKASNKKFINLAGINYLLESKKNLGI